MFFGFTLQFPFVCQNTQRIRPKWKNTVLIVKQYFKNTVWLLQLAVLVQNIVKRSSWRLDQLLFRTHLLILVDYCTFEHISWFPNNQIYLVLRQPKLRFIFELVRTGRRANGNYRGLESWNWNKSWQHTNKSLRILLKVFGRQSFSLRQVYKTVT